VWATPSAVVCSAFAVSGSSPLLSATSTAAVLRSATVVPASPSVARCPTPKPIVPTVRRYARHTAADDGCAPTPASAPQTPADHSHERVELLDPHPAGGHEEHAEQHRSADDERGEGT